jgi:hypothetical protein
MIPRPPLNEPTLRRQFAAITQEITSHLRAAEHFREELALLKARASEAGLAKLFRELESPTPTPRALKSRWRGCGSANRSADSGAACRMPSRPAPSRMCRRPTRITRPKCSKSCPTPPSCPTRRRPPRGRVTPRPPRRASCGGTDHDHAQKSERGSATDSSPSEPAAPIEPEPVIFVPHGGAQCRRRVGVAGIGLGRRRTPPAGP